MVRHGILQARARQGLTMREAAERIGISPSHYWKIEHGKRTPSIGVAIQLSKVLDIPMDELFNDTLAAR